MKAKKTLDTREKELQALLATAAGRSQLRALKEQYEAEQRRRSPVGKSIISFILVHEREMGLIDG